MGFDFKADGVFFVEGDDAGVVDEYGETPVKSFCDKIFGCRSDGGFEQVMDGDGAVGVGFMAGAALLFHLFKEGRGAISGGFLVTNCGFQGFVDAVFGPGLGEGFEFDFRGLPALPLVFFLDFQHLFGAEEEVRISGQALELRFVEVQNVYSGDVRGESVLAAFGEGLGVVGRGGDFVDDGVGEVGGDVGVQAA